MVYDKDHASAFDANKSTTESDVDPTTVGPLYSAKDHDNKFDPKEYLEGFYSTHKDDGAMQMVLFFLPGILYRLPETVENLLDLGAGPTVYIPIVARKRAKNIYTSDYSQVNREKLVEWIKNESNFDWSNICNWISCIESTTESPKQMQDVARSKMRAVFEVNVHKNDAIQSLHYKIDNSIIPPKQFDAIITIFCLEYASEKKEEYKCAVKNAIKLIKPGGYLIQGGVLHADEYCFAGVRFKCYYLTREQVVESLRENSMCTDDSSDHFRLIVSGEVFLLISKKLK